MKMNDRLVVGQLLIGLLLVVYCVGVEDIQCDNVYEACYYKTGDEDGSVMRGASIPLSRDDFVVGARIVMEQPNEFEENRYGNPFPLITIMFYADKDKAPRDFYFKIKNTEKNDISKTQDASLLEGNYEYPYLIISVPYIKGDSIDDRPYLLHASVLKPIGTTNYLYSILPKFPMNAYVDFFRNKVLFDFSSVSVNSIIKRDENTAYREDSMFQHNLRAYQRACSEVRMEDNTTATEFKKKTLEKLENEEKKNEYKLMKITDFLRSVDYLKRMGSFCGEIKDSVSSDNRCLRANPNKCQSFFRLEKINTVLYQFHLFTKEHISYVILRFVNAKKPDVKLEIICERGKEFLEYTLAVGDERTPIKKYLPKLNMNDSLIYSTLDDLLYCGVRMPFYMPVVMGSTEMQFDLTNQSILEIDFGSYASDQKTRIITWHTQFPLSFDFTHDTDVEWELATFVLFGLVGGFIILLCVLVSGWIINKYNSLSKKLTEAGSNISNLSIMSGVSGSNVVNPSQANSAMRPRSSSLPSEIITPTNINSSMASRFGRNIDRTISSARSERSQTGTFSNRLASPSEVNRSSTAYSSKAPSKARSRSKSKPYRT